MKVSLMRRYALLIVLTTLGIFTAGDVWAQNHPKLRGRYARYRLKIDSAPQKAAIYLDDKKSGIIGYTPWTGKIKKGTTKIILELNGYETAEKKIYVRRTRRWQKHFIPMVKKDMPAIVDIRADADKNAFNAEVWLDGQLQGQIPIILKVKEGRHLITIKKKGFQDFSRWETVTQNQKISLNPVLKAVAVKPKVKKGDILVESDVSGAEVWIDGNKHKDSTPTIIRGVIEGPHVIEVKKAPAIPWKQTVQVVANKTVKVSAKLKATIGGPVAKIKVLANVDKARVFLDGKEMGTAPYVIPDVKPGQHVVGVKAAGYHPVERRITVNAGQTYVENFKMAKIVKKAEKGMLKIVSKVPEATVYVDGKSVGTAPQQVELPPGDHFVVVEKKGHKKFERKINLRAGQTITVAAELRAVGGVRFLSNPSGAEVLLDSQPIGKTPLVKDDIDVGDHGVTIRYPDYYDYETNIKVVGGKLKVINAKLEMIDTGPTPAQLAREQRGLTSFGARTLPRGRSTIDIAVGYPYYLDGRITVGAGKLFGMGFDAGFMARSFFSRTELGITGRFNLAIADPFSFGAFTTLGGGSNFFDDTGRNTFFYNLGVIGSLTGLGAVTVTGRAYLEFWSDRHCPEANTMTNTFSEGDPISMCQKYLNNELNATEKERVDDLLDGGSPFERESGVRGMLSLFIEIAWRQRWNLWLQFEGAPFQAERPAYTHKFNPALFKEDIGTYFRFGTTYKF